MKINLIINGKPQEINAEPDTVLLDVLRKDLRLTGAKQSCNRKGQCGACTVIVNGKAVPSCLMKVATLEDAEIITVEGLGTPENPHLIQEAFVLAGAVQCGFCTPGMIMAAKALLDKNPDPDIPTIKRALTRNLCRCTGYTKIIDAIQLAAKFLRGETTPKEVLDQLEDKALGVSHPRPTAMLKACGLAEFTADIDLPDALELAQVHSTEAHALIKSVDISEALKMPGVAGVMLAKDLKGTNRIRPILPDQPVLCEDKVRTYGDPIAAVAAETREQARAAAAAVKVEYEPLPAMNALEAIAPGAYQIHEHASGNIAASQPLIKGDTEKALKEAAFVVESEFSTQSNHQSPLEPEASVAYFEGKGDNPQLIVVGRSINIHAHLAQIKEAVGYENMRYKEAYSGGQFGIKLSVSTEVITAAAALHFKRPVRYIPSLAESMQVSTKRFAFPSQKMKLATDKDGYMTAFTFDFVCDKGAYTNVGTGTMMRAIEMVCTSYNIPNVKMMGRAAYSNNASGGAARGAGPPEAVFAMESLVDMTAHKVGIDPLEFRRMNALQPGQAKATGMIVNQFPYVEVCDAMKPHYDRAKKDAEEFNKKNTKLKRGVGISGHSFGIGGAGDSAKMAVQIEPDGGLSIFAAVADPGEGNDFISEVQNLQLSEVEVNTETGEARVLKMTSIVDCGTIINPQAVEGQLEGGMDQGVGYALREEYIHGTTSDWINFKFPTIQHSFESEIILLETPRENGPLGAIGVGEMAMNSTAPAVINAINDACGARIYNLPATPDKVLAALKE